jgi:hypothetical protein
MCIEWRKEHNNICYIYLHVSVQSYIWQNGYLYTTSAVLYLQTSTGIHYDPTQKSRLNIFHWFMYNT